MHHFRTHTEINLGAIRRNAEAIKGYTGKQLIAVVKADAYGHGMIRVAEALHAVADLLAVATVEEGVTLRQAGIQKPILILFSSLPEEASRIVEYQLTPTVSDWEFASRLNETAPSSVNIHVNINTGMNRSGVRWTEAERFLE